MSLILKVADIRSIGLRLGSRLSLVSRVAFSVDGRVRLFFTNMTTQSISLAHSDDLQANSLLGASTNFRYSLALGSDHNIGDCKPKYSKTPHKQQPLKEADAKIHNKNKHWGIVLVDPAEPTVVSTKLTKAKLLHLSPPCEH